jgi:hypothetical protein
MSKQTNVVYTPAQISLLTSAVQSVWAVIGFDILESDPTADNEECIEACFDADRITMQHLTGETSLTGVEAQAIFRQAAKDHGYPTALRALAARIGIN